MRAAQIARPGGAFETVEREIPQPAIGWVRIKVCACHSDSLVKEGHWPGLQFPRVLGHFVRELHWITLTEAIRKMTSLPAWRLGLKDRGLIRPGYKADIVLFDRNRVIDRSTFQQPQLTAEGINRVFVNGVEVWRDGATTGNRPGRALRHASTAQAKS